MTRSAALAWALLLAACGAETVANRLTLRNTGSKGRVVFTMGRFTATLGAGDVTEGVDFQPGDEIVITSPDAPGEARVKLAAGPREVLSSAESGSVSAMDLALVPK